MVSASDSRGRAGVRGVPGRPQERGEPAMTGYHKWSDIRAEFVERAGGEEAVAEARRQTQAYIDGYRLAERRKALKLTQAVVAERMGVTKGRVSQIERGEVSTVETLSRYVEALGGRLQITAVFGDDLYILQSADPRNAGTAPQKADTAPQSAGTQNAGAQAA
ncbi:hypothetical protein Apa02nite_013200 [Actinoplanes palleronii]|uniref:HTH cro/C1-type domain-containing protein n=1 Tax=Actinoplanes palleronii TaxID=113570 RepID=A0ABQ4B3G9_9ACTN|nr:hypothetical protein Apa02nite_013200 [Actinoplanes palleronii]